MPTRHTPTLVSLAAVMTLTLALGCAAGPRAQHAATRRPDASPVIRFDNEERQHVHVYLVVPERQWLLGRVEPGAHARFNIPASALAARSTSFRLAVVPAQSISLLAAQHPGTRMTLPHTAAEMSSQLWTFAQGALSSVR